MATFVTVHGGWGGGWEWTQVAQELREQGHEVFTPTLSGLGDREHLGGATTSVSDHIDDVIKLLEFEQLRDVVLCGHSYSGIVVTGVADRVPERIKLLVYVDAFIADDGQAIKDLVPRNFFEEIMRSVAERGDGTFLPPEELLASLKALPEAKRGSYISRLRPQGLPTFTEPVRLSGAISRVTRAFVRCTQDDDMAPFAKRAESEGWLYREMPTPHDPQLFAPEVTARVLVELADVAAPVAADQASLTGAGQAQSPPGR